MSDWWQWQTGESYSIGLEEEMMLLDPAADWGLATRVGEVLDGAPAS